MRIDKLLSNLKYGSRKEIKNLIKNNHVKVNGKTIQKESLIVDTAIDIVSIFDEEVYYREEINLMIYKPVDYLSANKDKLHKVVVDLLKEPYSRYDFKIAGRLDLDSEGLMILTTMGDFAHIITSPNSKISKTYEVTLDSSVNEYKILLDGIIIKDGKNNEYLAKALDIIEISNTVLEITIDEGKFHQVRRMFKAIGNEVIKLKRIKIGNLELKDLLPGEYIEIKRNDVI